MDDVNKVYKKVIDWKEFGIFSWKKYFVIIQPNATIQKVLFKQFMFTYQSLKSFKN